MKYALEIIDVMASYREREWKMAELVRFCVGSKQGRERNAVRAAVSRVLLQLESSGHVQVNRTSSTSATYCFRSACPTFT